MRRQMIRIDKGTLVKNKYAISTDYGITTSDIEYHAPRNTNHCIEYVWVLWNNGDHCLFKVDMLEVVNEGR